MSTFAQAMHAQLTALYQRACALDPMIALGIAKLIVQCEEELQNADHVARDRTQPLAILPVTILDNYANLESYTIENAKETIMGGKPQKNTPADMRLAANKAKYGSVANRDAATTTTKQQPGKQQSKPMPNQPPTKKGM